MSRDDPLVQSTNKYWTPTFKDQRNSDIMGEEEKNISSEEASYEDYNTPSSLMRTNHSPNINEVLLSRYNFKNKLNQNADKLIDYAP